MIVGMDSTRHLTGQHKRGACPYLSASPGYCYTGPWRSMRNRGARPCGTKWACPRAGTNGSGPNTQIYVQIDTLVNWYATGANSVGFLIYCMLKEPKQWRTGQTVNKSTTDKF